MNLSTPVAINFPRNSEILDTFLMYHLHESIALTGRQDGKARWPFDHLTPCRQLRRLISSTHKPRANVCALKRPAGTAKNLGLQMLRGV